MSIWGKCNRAQTIVVSIDEVIDQVLWLKYTHFSQTSSNEMKGLFKGQLLFKNIECVW